MRYQSPQMMSDNKFRTTQTHLSRELILTISILWTSYIQALFLHYCLLLTLVPSDTIPGRFYFLEKLSSTWDSYILSKGIKKDSGKSFPGACSCLMLSETPITWPLFFRNTKRRKCLWETRKLQIAHNTTREIQSISINRDINRINIKDVPAGYDK